MTRRYEIRPTPPRPPIGWTIVLVMSVLGVLYAILPALGVAAGVVLVISLIAVGIARSVRR